MPMVNLDGQQCQQIAGNNAASANNKHHFPRF